MRRSRFRHCAYTICDIFCGWEKFEDNHIFHRKAEGAIEADILNESATLDGAPYNFNTVHIAHSWLWKDLSSNRIPADAITEARIELRFMRTDRPPTHFEVQFEGRGIIVSGEDRYEMPYQKLERWG